jgi:hypothetical protein
MRAYKFLDMDKGLKSLREKRLKISTVEDLNDPFELLPYEMTVRSRRWALRETRRELGSRHGMLCFSAEWRGPVIWAHYSDKHRGICLGFEIPEDCGKRVNYVGERLSLPENVELDNANAFLFTKYENWAYEKEIRCWTDLQTPEGGLYFMDFSDSLKLVEVIAGARCPATRSQIIEAVTPLSGITLIKARAGFQRFEIVKDQRGFDE